MKTKIITAISNDQLKTLIESFLSVYINVVKVSLNFSTSPPKLLVCTLLYDDSNAPYTAQQVDIFSNESETLLITDINSSSLLTSLSTFATAYNGKMYASVIIDSPNGSPFNEGYIKKDGSIDFDNNATEKWVSTNGDVTIGNGEINLGDGNSLVQTNIVSISIRDASQNSVALGSDGVITQKISNVTNTHIIKGITTAAAVLDATQYLNVVINNVPVKLAIIV